MTAIARFSLVAIDCRDPRALAEFYGAITGWKVDPRSSEDWVELIGGEGATIAFQLAPGHVAPAWPGDDHPQQAHLDFDVVDLDVGEQQVLAAGARKAEFQPDENWRVFLDPAGHPFCLVLDHEMRPATS